MALCAVFIQREELYFMTTRQLISTSVPFFGGGNSLQRIPTFYCQQNFKAFVQSDLFKESLQTFISASLSGWRVYVMPTRRTVST
jgi:hypothetical protein